MLGLTDGPLPEARNSNDAKRDQLMMDTEALNKTIVGRWFTSLWSNPCDLGIVDDLAVSDVVLQYSIHPRRGRQAVKAFMAEFRTAFPDFGLRRIGPLIADRDIVVVRWEGSGTHSGPAFDDLNIGPLPAASGRKVMMTGHTAVRLQGGLIVEEAVWSTERKVQLRCLAGGLLV